MPIFSVIIPLEFDRGQWEHAFEAWTSQTVQQSAYELIFVLPEDFAGMAQLTERCKQLDVHALIVLSAQDRETSTWDAGVSQAQGTHLVITESHCWPDKDVLALCLDAVTSQPQWSGFSCQAIPGVRDRMSIAEANMYAGDIADAMRRYAWRTVNRQCLVTRKEAYLACGGLRGEWGHFSEWALAVSYVEKGYVIGYLPEARFHHYYGMTALEAIRFNLNFISGESKYFSRSTRQPAAHLLPVPPEWMCQGNHDAQLARTLIRNIVTYFFDSGQKWKALNHLKRWYVVGLSGNGCARLNSVLALLPCLLSVSFKFLLGSQQALNESYKKLNTALTHFQRLRVLHQERRGNNLVVKNRDALAVQTERTGVHTWTGFYPLEKFESRPFQWSEAAAAVRLTVNAGRQRIRIKCLPVRMLLNDFEISLYLDHLPVCEEHILITAADIHIQITNNTGSDQIVILSWICSAFKASGDARVLGLPVVSIQQCCSIPGVETLPDLID